MNVIPPIDINDANFTSSTIPELDPNSDPTEWNSATSYTSGDYASVFLDHAVYQALVDNTNVPPGPNVDAGSEGVGDTWQLIRPTNKWAMFDLENSTESTADGKITVRITPGRVVGAVAAFNVNASTITITQTDPQDGVVYQKSVSTQDNTGVTNWYRYYYEPIKSISEFVVDDLPAYINSYIDVTFENNTNNPFFTGATASNTTCKLFYNKALSGSSVPATSDFALTGSVTGTFTISNVAVSGHIVTLTLDETVNSSETMTISYSVGANPIKDAADRNAAALINKQVVNITSDSIVPVMATGTINGTALLLNYTEQLDSGSVPATGDFILTGSVTGEFSISGVSVSDNYVQITTSAAPQLGEEIKITYSAGANPIRDLASNNAANLINEEILNLNSSISVGTLLLGTKTNLGVTLMGTRLELLDFSQTNVDEFGKITVRKRRTAKLVDFDAFTTAGLRSNLFRTLDDLVGTPAAWYSDDDTATNDATLVFGFQRNTQITLSDRTGTDFTVQVQGLT